MEASGGEVVVASNLVLDLEAVGEVGTGHDRAHGSGGTILPRVLPLLDTVPGEEERLVEVVEHVDDNVVVGGAVDLRPRELTVNEDALLGDTQWRNGAVGDIPLEEQVRVLSPYHRHAHQQQSGHHSRRPPHALHDDYSPSSRTRAVFIYFFVYFFFFFLLYFKKKKKKEGRQCFLPALVMLPCPGLAFL